jgi:hypothetical protein
MIYAADQKVMSMGTVGFLICCVGDRADEMFYIVFPPVKRWEKNTIDIEH